MPADRLILVNAMVGQFIIGFATRSFVVGVPTIASALHADIAAISWAIVAYQFANISLSVVFGRLGDVHGRRLIYGTGFGIMAVSALACGLATTVTWLVLFRLVALRPCWRRRRACSRWRRCRTTRLGRLTA